MSRPTRLKSNFLRQKVNRKVSFAELEIRVYPNTLGDHPDCKFGPPISIDWDHIQAEKVPLEEYEASRSPRRTIRQLQIPSYVRKRLLREEWGIPAEDLVEAAKEVRRIKKLREKSNSTAFLGPFEEAYENLIEMAQFSVKPIQFLILYMILGFKMLEMFKDENVNHNFLIEQLD